MKRSALFSILSVFVTAIPGFGANWYETSFYLLHEDHHTSDRYEVGRDASLEETSRLVGLSQPDVIQIHAKGNPGWTTYPTEIGHTPPKLARDVLGVWRDVARRDGYHFSVYYNIGRDGVIMKRRPEWNRSRADGGEWDRAICYHSGVAEGYLWPMVREIIERYHPDGFWFDGSCFTVRVCYCDQCRDRFRREHGLAPPKSPEEPGWAAYHEMQRQIYREFIHDTAAMIHEMDPECLVAFNWAYSLRMPDKPDEGIAYLTGDIGNRVEGLSAEAHWYDSLDVPFDLMTQVNTLDEEPEPKPGEPAVRMAPKPAEQIEQEMAIIIANGGRYFAWDSPTPQSGILPERLEFLGKVVAPFLRARQPWCLGSKRVPDVSLLHSAAAHYAATETATTSFTKRDNRIDGAAEALPRLHLNYEMVPDWRLEAQDVRSRLLIVEHPKRLKRETVDALIEYVRGGGRLLMTGMGIGLDKRLEEVFGVAGVTGPGGPEPLVFPHGDSSIPFDHWLFRLELSTATRLVGVRDAAGQTHPVLTENRFGQGTAYYAALPLLAQHGKRVVPKPLLETVFDRASPRAERLLSTDAPDSVEVVLREKDGQYIVHLVNMHPGHREMIEGGRRRYPKITNIPPLPECRVWVRLPARPTTVQLQPEGVPLEGWSFAEGRLEATVPGGGIHEMVVVDLPR
jgi:hypothetical protein